MKDRCANGDLLELGDSIHSNSLSITHKGGFSLGLQRCVSQGFQRRDPQTQSGLKAIKKLTISSLHQNFSRVSGCKTILNPLRNQIRAQSRTEGLRICIL